MIKNIYKSYITTILGVLFGLADIAYLFLNKSPEKGVLLTLAIIAVVFLFMSDKRAKELISKIL